MKKISPMLEAKRQQSGKKLTVQRMYGESLTSMEFINKLTEEEAGRQKKKGVKRGRPKASGGPTTSHNDKGKRSLRQAAKEKKTTLVCGNEDTSDESVVDMESDDEWVPPRKRQNESGSDDDEDDDNDFQPVGIVERNVFETLFN